MTSPSLPSQPVLLGLGNPGARYAATRHNVGAQFVRTLWTTPGRTSSRCPVRMSGNAACRLAITTTYMNQSGAAARCLLAFLRRPPQDLIVVHDDSDLPFGTWRLQYDRGAAGHNGVRDVIAALGTKAFWRVRIGVRPAMPAGAPRQPAGAFVLQPFRANEQAALPELFRAIAAALPAACRDPQHAAS